MVPFLGRRDRTAIVGIVVIVGFVSVGVQYSSMFMLSDVLVPITETTTATFEGGFVAEDVDEYSRVIMEEVKEDDDDFVVEENKLFLYDQDNEKIPIESNDQNNAVLEDRKTLTLPACLRARNDTIPESMYGKMSFPVINLGLPKIGSTSIHSFFGNAGYESNHLICPRKDRSGFGQCAECIVDSIAEGLSPLQLCRDSDVYSQIDGTVNNTMYFPQIDLLEEIVRGQPNATFLLTFRSMDGWYKSISQWGTLMKRILNADLSINEISLGAGSQQDFINFFCEHVRRVREIVPPNQLVEIDIDDPTVGARLSDIFDIDEECWSQVNVNGKLHPEIEKNRTVFGSMTPRWNISGQEMIRGKNGIMRMKLNDSFSSQTIQQAVRDDENTLPDCLRARRNTIPRSMYGKLSFPVVNLGFPKMGSTSIHEFFGNAGYESLHLRCETFEACAECISQSIEEGLPPLHLCRSADVYSQIDGSANNTLYFPQIDHLNEFVHGHPNATFLLPFRSMDGWYQSVSRWGTLWKRMTTSKLSVGEIFLGSGSQQEFTNFFCEHVRRVREIVPSNRLVEIDIEDPTVGARMSDIFDVDEGFWSKTNVNGKLHPEIGWSTKPNWRIVGQENIRSKNGTMRVNSSNATSSHTPEITLRKWNSSIVIPDCLRARNYTKSIYGNFTLPVINLGFPKMGSTSIHSFFENAGFKSLHWKCPKDNHDTNKTKCAQCIQQSVQARVPPLELCPKADVYAQIDGGIDGIYQFPQIDLLKDLVFGYPNATFLLTFRRMDSWYQSISRWPPQHDIPYLKERLLVTNSTGGKYLGVGSMQDFTNFFCKHVRRVRAIVPPNRLVEIDIEDSSTGERMADIFAIDKRLWGRTNVNTKLHPEAKKKRKKKKIVWRRKKTKAKKN